jgi:hypothetical protein
MEHRDYSQVPQAYEKVRYAQYVPSNRVGTLLGYEVMLVELTSAGLDRRREGHP